MTWIVLFLFALCLAEGEVVVLTSENFDETIKLNPIVMVKFFAPWCGHCKAFAPEYERAAKLAKERNLNYVIAELDATIHKDIADSQNIKGFPTIKLFFQGRSIDYDGERTADDVISFIDKKTGPPSTELLSAKDMEEFKNLTGLKSLLVNNDPDALDVYMKIAGENENYKFYHADLKLIKDSFEGAVTKKTKVLIFTDFNKDVVTYTDTMTEKGFRDFLSVEMLPLINNVTQTVVEQVFRQNGRTGIILFRNDNDKESLIYDDYLAEIAKPIRIKGYVFIVNNKVDEWGARVSEYLGIEEMELPIFMIIDSKDDVFKYLHTGKLTKNSMQKFIQDYENGKLQIYYKSETIPTENPGPVYKVVAGNFKEYVLDNDDDVLLKFYAPWCGHCNKLIPVFENLAITMAENKKLKFMEVDATKNDIEGHPINGFPVMKLFPGKNKANPITYNGVRDEPNIAKFIKEHSSYDIKVPEFQNDEDDGELGKDDL